MHIVCMHRIPVVGDFYFCTLLQCNSKYCELPVECQVCGEFNVRVYVCMCVCVYVCMCV